MEINSAAPVITREEILTNAPGEAIWRYLGRVMALDSCLRLI